MTQLSHSITQATIEAIDWGVGEILKSLKKHKLDKPTIVVFTSDNGPWLTKKKGKNVGSALPLRDGKGTTYDGGQRVPASCGHILLLFRLIILSHKTTKYTRKKLPRMLN